MSSAQNCGLLKASARRSERTTAHSARTATLGGSASRPAAPGPRSSLLGDDKELPAEHGPDQRDLQIEADERRRVPQAVAHAVGQETGDLLANPVADAG